MPVLCLQVKKDNPGLQKLVYGAFGLPFGLAMIVICGGELYTSNAAFMPAAIFEASRRLDPKPYNLSLGQAAPHQQPRCTCDVRACGWWPTCTPVVRSSARAFTPC